MRNFLVVYEQVGEGVELYFIVAKTEDEAKCLESMHNYVAATFSNSELDKLIMEFPEKYKQNLCYHYKKKSNPPKILFDILNEILTVICTGVE